MHVSLLRLFCAGAIALATGTIAAAQDKPLSAIGWLSDVTTTPLPAPVLPEEDVSRGLSFEAIEVSPLDAPNGDTIGLMPASVSGLPERLWGPSTGPELTRLLDRIDPDNLLPTARELLFTLLLTELEAPFGSDGSGDFLLSRIRKLVRLGAIEQANAMIEQAATSSPEHFETFFELSLYLGRESLACDLLAQSPALSRDLPTRIFCLARNGDWAAASVSLDSGRAMSQIDGARAALLERFLDIDLDDDPVRLAAPVRPDPLTFHLFDAIGEPLPTTGLPLAYAHRDLTPRTGWKAQLEAAERLAAAGALPSNQLLGLYTRRKPAASGGVWERARAVQAFDEALALQDAAEVRATLPRAWVEMQDAGLEATFASLYSDQLRFVELDGIVEDRAFRMTLLTEDYAKAAAAHPSAAADAAFLAGLAAGKVSGIVPPGPRGAAIADAFNKGTPPRRFAHDIDRRAIGAALLKALARLGDGQSGDVSKLTDALALFRTLGLEDMARRTALELLILDTRG